MALDQDSVEAPGKSEWRITFALIVIGLLSSSIYGVVCWLSAGFLYDLPDIGRPILLTLSLFVTTFLLYVLALRLGVKSRTERPAIVLSFAIVFRVITLFSHPIQEVDIYRYVWDGIVFTSGVSPFDYSPQQVLEASPSVASKDLSELVSLRDSSPAIRQVLERVHFGELPTVYPPSAM